MVSSLLTFEGSMASVFLAFLLLTMVEYLPTLQGLLMCYLLYGAGPNITWVVGAKVLLGIFR